MCYARASELIRAGYACLSLQAVGFIAHPHAQHHRCVKEFLAGLPRSDIVQSRCTRACMRMDSPSSACVCVCHPSMSMPSCPSAHSDTKRLQAFMRKTVVPAQYAQAAEAHIGYRSLQVHSAAPIDTCWTSVAS